MPTLDPRAVAAELLAARAERRTIAPLTDSQPLTMDDAYRVQLAGLALRRERGERRVGWKLGYTSAAMREQMHVEGPNFGPLTDVMRAESGVEVAGRLTQPRVEPELLVVMGDRGVSTVHACLEVVDSVYTDYRFSLADNTADGSSAGMFVVGPRLDVDPKRLADVPVQLCVDGEEVESATGAAADGDPLRGVTWLAEQLALRGCALRPRDVVLTGGLTRAHPLAEGSTISARFGEAAVTVRGGSR
jgi:2-keto-4-pentenoate hydratase